MHVGEGYQVVVMVTIDVAETSYSAGFFKAWEVVCLNHHTKQEKVGCASGAGLRRDTLRLEGNTSKARGK